MQVLAFAVLSLFNFYSCASQLFHFSLSILLSTFEIIVISCMPRLPQAYITSSPLNLSWACCCPPNDCHSHVFHLHPEPECPWCCPQTAANGVWWRRPSGCATATPTPPPSSRVASRPPLPSLAAYPRSLPHEPVHCHMQVRSLA